MVKDFSLTIGIPPIPPKKPNQKLSFFNNFASKSTNGQKSIAQGIHQITLASHNQINSNNNIHLFYQQPIWNGRINTAQTIASRCSISCIEGQGQMNSNQYRNKKVSEPLKGQLFQSPYDSCSSQNRNFGSSRFLKLANQSQMKEENIEVSKTQDEKNRLSKMRQARSSDKIDMKLNISEYVNNGQPQKSKEVTQPPSSEMINLNSNLVNSNIVNNLNNSIINNQSNKIASSGIMSASQPEKLNIKKSSIFAPEEVVFGQDNQFANQVEPNSTKKNNSGSRKSYVSQSGNATTNNKHFLLKKVHTIEEKFESQIIDSLEDYDKDIEEEIHPQVGFQNVYHFLNKEEDKKEDITINGQKHNQNNHQQAFPSRKKAQKRSFSLIPSPGNNKNVININSNKIQRNLLPQFEDQQYDVNSESKQFPVKKSPEQQKVTNLLKLEVEKEDSSYVINDEDQEFSQDNHQKGVNMPRTKSPINSPRKLFCYGGIRSTIPSQGCQSSRTNKCSSKEYFKDYQSEKFSKTHNQIQKIKNLHLHQEDSEVQSSAENFPVAQEQNDLSVKVSQAIGHYADDINTTSNVFNTSVGFINQQDKKIRYNSQSQVSQEHSFYLNNNYNNYNSTSSYFYQNYGNYKQAGQTPQFSINHAILFDELQSSNKKFLLNSNDSMQNVKQKTNFGI